jgi:benzoyl-CoA 2,3-dioxygenase component B
MLKEEAYHMFVGASGIGRVIQRTCDLMHEFNTSDVREHGAIDLPTLQKYLNFHFSVSLDLFGSETSTNAANYFSAGLKGRFGEPSYSDDHVLNAHSDYLDEIVGSDFVTKEYSAITLVNQELRRSYIEDCAKGLRRWNRIISEMGVETVLTLPHEGFNRHVGKFRDHHLNPSGEIISQAEWDKNKDSYLPSENDREYVVSLMKPVYEPGLMASWIAAPSTGINTQPVGYEYVKM